MSLIDIKYQCLDVFYRYIDLDITMNRFRDYESSLEKLFVNNFFILNCFEKIVWCFAITQRYARSGMLFSTNGKIEKELKKELNEYRRIDLSKYDLSEEDKIQLENDAKEAEQYLNWLERKRKTV